MRASAVEFRLRMAIMVAVITLGFWAPWIEYGHIGRRIGTLEWLALELSRTGLADFGLAIPIVIVLASLIAALGAILRVWGTAYLGAGVVNGLHMQAGSVVASGPYRYVRNPLYLGSWCMIVAMACAMPATGALFTVVLNTIFLLRLILGEEAFLSRQLGEPYRLYLRSVPRLFPRLRTTLPEGAAHPHWAHAALAEINPIGIFLITAILSWRYDSGLMTRAILICFGLSLVVRALVPQAPRDTPVSA